MILEDDIRQRVRHVLKGNPDASTIGFHDSRAIQITGDELEVEGGKFCQVVQCPSDLAMRRALLARDPQKLLVLVTPLTYREVGADVLCRLTKRRLLSFDPWDAVATLFQANAIDDVLRKSKVLGHTLLRQASKVDYPLVSTGLLTEQHAWESLIANSFEMALPLDELDLWIVWSMTHPKEVRRLFSLEGLMTELREYLRLLIGPHVDLLFDQLEQHQHESRPGLSLLVYGLALRAANDAESTGSEHQGAATRIRTVCEERFGARSDVERRWSGQIAKAASRAYLVLKRQQPALMEGAIKRLDSFFLEYDATSIATCSRASYQGWSSRLEDFAAALDEGDARQMQSALEHVRDHDEAQRQAKLVTHLDRAARLSFKLHCKDWDFPEQATLAELAREYIDSSSFEDRIRAELITLDSAFEVVHDAITRLLDLAASKRQRENARFATLLASSLSQGDTPSGVLPIHRVLERVVEPLVVAQGRVLMLVLDGMSWGVTRALLEDPLMQRWAMWVPSSSKGHLQRAPQKHLPMFAALPSITNLSRTSLLTGRLQTGNQTTEKAGFEGNMRLRKVLPKSPKGACMQLFHKASLNASGMGGVGEELRSALRDPKVQVLGVVLNTIDDQLGGAQQLNLQWSVDKISALQSLLELSFQQRMTVILTSDHGHVLDDRTQLLSGNDAHSARFRPLTDKMEEGEVRIEATSIQEQMGTSACVLLHDERLRYTKPKRGYHGGASMPEVITPLVVMTPGNEEMESLDEFQELQTATPGWWRFNEREKSVHTPQRVRHRVTLHEEEEGDDDSPQLGLLDSPLHSPPVEESLDEPSSTDDAWIERLFDSPLYIQQQNRSHVSVAPDEVYQVFVILNAAPDHKAAVGMIANVLSRAENRVRNLIVGITHLVNLDGYMALSFNRKEATVQLDRDLLFKQFSL